MAHMKSVSHLKANNASALVWCLNIWIELDFLSVNLISYLEILWEILMGC